MADFHDISEIVNISRGALDLMKGAVGLIPKGEDRERAEAKLKDAEEALRRSDAKLAKELGYELCKCTFPPQVMLSTGYHKQHNVEIFKCPNCDKQEPSEHTIQMLDENAAVMDRFESGDDWRW